MEWQIITTLFGVFALLLALGIPISFAIGLSSLAALMWSLPLEPAISVIAQRMATGLDSFSLLAIPFFILAGNIMNQGGIALRLINLAKVLGGRLPGPLVHCNVLANMMFGALSGSAVAAAAAVGGVMAPLQEKEGYDPAFSAAVNITSCPTGLLIPPSNTLIVYSLISGGTSISALFLAGYLPGILMGLGIMLIAGFIAKRRGYVAHQRATFNQVLYYFWHAIPSLMLIVLIMGGIIGGIFTATEGSAIAVIYTIVLAMIYREIKFTDLPRIILSSAVTTSIVLLLIGTSMGMSWVMANADIPYIISDTINTISSNPIIILLIINLILLCIGMFMDMTPALLIFTPIFLPIVLDLGVDPVHFGILMTFNLSLGICTPPVGSALFVGCSIAKISIDRVIKPLLPFFAILLVTLMLVTYIPNISLILPKLLLGYER